MMKRVPDNVRYLGNSEKIYSLGVLPPVTQSCPFMMTVANGRGEWNASVGRRPFLDVQRCRSKWEIEARQIAAKLSIDTSVLAGRL
jgi:hypothetical protein